MVRKRSRATEFREEDLDRSPSPPHVVHRHTDIDIDSIHSGRQTRRARTSYISLPKSPVKQRGTTDAHLSNADDVYSYDDPTFEPLQHALDSESDADSDDSDFEAMDPSKNKPPKPCTDEPHLRHWLPLVPQFLDEFFRHDAPTANPLRCCSCADDCSDDEPLFRCVSCYEGIEEWNGDFFVRSSLHAQGFHMALGHDEGQRCYCTRPATLQVIDLEGIQSLAVDFCDCLTALPRWQQLLRACLFPSTVVEPQIVATFRSLQTFQVLSFMSKVTGYEFYHTMARLSDNTGTATPTNKSPKDLANSEGVPISAGSLAVQCPACPWPGLNMPEGWETETDKPWRHALFLAIDANFHLVRFAASSGGKDPSLNKGGAFLVEQVAFCKHVKEYGSRLPYDPSDCNQHDAVQSATRRQVQMDYIFLNRLAQNTPTRIVVSYNIACQWSKKLFERIAIYPDSMTLSQGPNQMTFLVPKFHLPAHIVRCHAKFSFWKTPYMGQTDGEAPKRGWDHTNRLTGSVKNMGPGSYLDTVDDHLGDYNWQKATLLGPSLLKGVREAIPARIEQAAVLAEFTKSLPKPNIVAWTKAVEEWEENPERPNPFETTVPQLTKASVRVVLAQEEANDLETPVTDEDEEGLAAERVEHVMSAPKHLVGPSQMIFQGLEIENHQCHLKRLHSALGPHSTDRQRAKVMEGLNSLRRWIEVWATIQESHVVGVKPLRAEWKDATQAAAAAAEAAEEAEAASSNSRKRKKKKKKVVENLIAVAEWPLFLPSSVAGHVSQTLKLLDCEFRLREAEAYECLTMMRRQLLYRSHIYKFKNRHITGQLLNTRANTTVKSVVASIDEVAARYRYMHTRLVVLHESMGTSATGKKKDGWDRALRVLREEDIRALDEGNINETEGSRQISWIWRIHRHTTDAEEMNKALRIEWCKARAWAHRWDEEVTLTLTEMERTLLFFSAKQEQWMQRAARTDISAGERAYALRQADIRLRMKKHAELLWAPVAMWNATGDVPKLVRGRRPKTQSMVVDKLAE
ncbi:uncharacterized protein ARMOST_20746 [Armillaria ostoyae]|uniref:CxC2-like cysteine cluster KDZ transposase-associated domain-containing protein n=1 Tax=Armillaria ostoyae TaxID=47428 RepID=A0A284S8A5_ARMOS|nr:uncharacterized protein ARMOST_20746 [Armillaria ostoyae]